MRAYCCWCDEVTTGHAVSGWRGPDKRWIRFSCEKCDAESEVHKEDVEVEDDE